MNRILQKSGMSPWEHNLQQYLSGIFTFASWTTADPSISTGSLSFLKELSNYFLLPCDRPTLGRLLGPECLDVLVLFSPGLQKTTGFMLNLNSIIVSVWFCCLMLVFFFFFSFFFFFVKGQKQFGFRSKCIRKVWFGIQLIRVIGLWKGDLISTSFVCY